MPERVYDSGRREFTDFEMMLAQASSADVLFVGEQHDDSNSHHLELAVLEGLARRRSGVLVGLEMFERDVQDPLDHFQMGHLEEADFLKASRPWPNYQTDYKPLVDFAVAREWPIFASNVPRPLASEVSRSGLGVLGAKPADQKKWFAQDLKCDASGAYFSRFAEAMSDHPSGSKPAPAAAREQLERLYQAQCLKDETMGESIAQAYATGAASGKRPMVVHFNGAFHSDFGEGTVERVRRRLPGKRLVVVTLLPLADLDRVAPGKDDRKRADFLVYTIGKH